MAQLIVTITQYMVWMAYWRESAQQKKDENLERRQGDPLLVIGVNALVGNVLLLL